MNIKLTLLNLIYEKVESNYKLKVYLMQIDNQVYQDSAQTTTRNREPTSTLLDGLGLTRDLYTYSTLFLYTNGHRNMLFG